MLIFHLRLWLTILLSLSFFHNISFSQVVFKEYPDYQIRSSDYIFFDVTETRSIIPLNGKWLVRPSDDEKAPKVTVGVPSIFEGGEELIFEKTFSLTPDQISKKVLELVFFCINYTADISVNNIIIYRHGGGEYPFKFELPRDILRSEKENLLSVRLKYKLDSKNSVPLKQRFLYPKNNGGIVSDVFIHLRPDIFISKNNINSKLSPDYKKAEISVESIIRNTLIKKAVEPEITPAEYRLSVSVANSNGETIQEFSPSTFTLGPGRDISVNQVYNIDSPVLWSPENPESYLLEFKVFLSDSLLDVTYNSISFYEFKSTSGSFLLNGKEFILKGVTYFPSNNIYGKLLPYDQMEYDITLIKDAGFNSVRFAKCVPHPYYLKLCEQYGLLAFIELPINGVPPGIAQDQSFQNRCKEFLFNYVNFYGEYSSVAALGIGGGFMPEIESHASLISILAGSVKEKTDLITYASFSDINLKEIENLDIYGLEFLNQDINDVDENFKRLQNDLGAGRIFISEAGYTVNAGSSDGYVNDYSFEAQAKFFEQLLTYADKNYCAGYFLNTLADYRGDYASLLSGYNEENLYMLGLLDENRGNNRITYKVVNARLNNLQKVTIPIGSKKEDAPMGFIIFGLVLAIFMGALVNSGRKFREDASRALLRPYNFFADIRDQRIISAYQTTLLGIIIAAVMALVESNILFYLKTSLLFEKLLLSFASPSIIKVASYLVWHPLMSLVWLTIFNVVFIIILSIIIKTASLSVRTKVYINGVYFTVIWSLLPVVLLIPVGIILYRVLTADVANVYIYTGLVLIFIWILYRLMKGVYVLFDANPATVYFYCILILLIVSGGALFYFELESSTVQYLLFTLKQFNVL
jgi:beta-galactosidase